MAVQQKAKAKGRKIGRNKKHQATIYKSACRLETNKKRKMMKHIRSNPFDLDARALFRAQFTNPDSLALNCRGRKLKERAERMAEAA